MSSEWVTAGAMADDSNDTTVVTKHIDPHTDPALQSDAEESDTELWLHTKHSAGSKKLIQSPDTVTDTYHVGLPLTTPQMEVIVPPWRETSNTTSLAHSSRCAYEGSRINNIE